MIPLLLQDLFHLQGSLSAAAKIQGVVVLLRRISQMKFVFWGVLVCFIIQDLLATAGFRVFIVCHLSAVARFRV